MSMGLGIYGNHIVRREDNSFDKKVRDIHDGNVSAHSTTFDNISANKLTKVVSKIAKSNSDRHAEAIGRADSGSFAVAFPAFLQTPDNIRLLNHQLKTMGVFERSTFPDFVAAYESLKDAGLLQLDEEELARQEPRTYRGTITGRTFDSVDEMISAERQAAIEKLPQPSLEEIEFENLPQDQVLTLLKQGERAEQQKLTGPQTSINGDAWITLHAEYIDNTHNAKLMRLQLATNGVLEDVATIQDYETAYQQLRASGLLTLNQKALAKQHHTELQQRAAEAVAEGGSVFDTTTEIDMETMDMTELRNRANKALARG